MGIFFRTTGKDGTVMNIKSDSATDISANLEDIVGTGGLDVQDKDSNIEEIKGVTSRETKIKTVFGELFSTNPVDEAFTDPINSVITPQNSKRKANKEITII